MAMTTKTCVEDVPDEWLAAVFESLHCEEDRAAAALTCRRWRALEGLSRHTLRFVGRHGGHDMQQEADFLYREWRHASGVFPHIFHVFVDGFAHLPDSFFAFLQPNANAFTQLTALHLKFCLKITDLCLNHIAAGCPSLKHLTLTRCFQMTDAGLHVIARGLPSLEHLDVSYCKEISDEGIDEVLRSCGKMLNLSVAYCHSVHGWGLRSGKRLQAAHAEGCALTDAGLVEGLKGATSLQILNMANLRSGVRLRAAGLSQLGISSEKMEILCLRMCRVLDDLAVKKIAQGCPNLRVWDLSVCQEVTFEGWQAVALFCAKLQHLDVQRCRRFCDRSLLAVQESCASLCCIHLGLCPSLSPESCRDFVVTRPDVKMDTLGALTNCCHIT